MEKRPALELPLGTSSFKTLRQANQIYVDKTDIIFNLASKRTKYFLVRPRRFGKSLLVSTLECLFKEGTNNFKGLKIENLWSDNRTYSVIVLDFSIIGYFTNIKDFKEKLRSLIAINFNQLEFQLPISDNSFYTAFSVYLRNLETNSLVLLIDEYDFPLTACLHNPELFEGVSREISNLYACIKSADNAIRFLFITGITKLGEVSIFSSLNNLVDLTLAGNVATLLGYTKEELGEYFQWYIDNASKILNMGRDQLIENMVINYDGFCFSGETKAHVLAPWSVLNFFNAPSAGFQKYWIESGGRPQALRQYLTAKGLSNPNDYFKPKQIPINSLRATSDDIKHIDDLVLLTQAGYLTIKSVGSSSFEIGYPNKEVADALSVLYREKLWTDIEMDNLGSTQLSLSLQNGSSTAFIETLNKFFLALDYKHFPIRSESECRNYTQLILMDRAGIEVSSESHNGLGSSDLEIRTRRYHWVLELKFIPAEKETPNFISRKLNEAKEQILKKHYGQSDISERHLIRLAMVFSEKHRKYIAWEAISSD